MRNSSPSRTAQLALLTDRVLLQNPYVRLEPLSLDHAEGLGRACEGLQQLWYTSVPSAETVEEDIRQRLAWRDQGLMNPWAVRDLSSDQIVGETTFCNIDQPNLHVEIGHTWLAPAVQGTRVNPSAKLLMMQHAFETCGVVAVEFRTHWHNRQSRAAIERLGAKQDGVLRNHRLGPDGSIRDTVCYSVLPHEWPAVRLGLLHRLAADRHHSEAG